MWWIPLCINAVITIFITQIFLGLFDEATMATLMCLAVDKDLNGEPKYGPPTFHEKLDKVFDEYDQKFGGGGQATVVVQNQVVQPPAPPVQQQPVYQPAPQYMPQ